MCTKRQLDQNMFLPNLEPKFKKAKPKANEDEDEPTMTKISTKRPSSVIDD
jgi:hypothetical protein